MVKAGSVHFRIVHLRAFACFFISLRAKLLFGGYVKKGRKNLSLCCLNAFLPPPAASPCEHPGCSTFIPPPAHSQASLSRSPSSQHDFFPLGL